MENMKNIMYMTYLESSANLTYESLDHGRKPEFPHRKPTAGQQVKTQNSLWLPPTSLPPFQKWKDFMFFSYFYKNQRLGWPVCSICLFECRQGPENISMPGFITKMLHLVDRLLPELRGMIKYEEKSCLFFRRRALGLACWKVGCFHRVNVFQHVEAPIISCFLICSDPIQFFLTNNMYIFKFFLYSYIYIC